MKWRNESVRISGLLSPPGIAEGALYDDVVTLCPSVCLSPTSTLKLHLPEGAAVHHDASISCCRHLLIVRYIGTLHLFNEILRLK